VVNIIENSMKMNNVKVFLQSYLKVGAYVYIIQCMSICVYYIMYGTP